MRKRRIAIAGSSGLVGSRLVRHLEANGDEVIRLVRQRPTGPGSVFWDPAGGQLDAGAIEGVDAVVNLAGVSIAGKRWSAARKQQILQSRIDATSLLARTMATLPNIPRVFISTSAVGYYGDAGSALLTEAALRGDGFLAGVCEQWEAAADPARQAGIRVVHPRFGIVMAGDGGMLPPIARLFRFGLGGRIGNGQQFLSWVDLDDLVAIIDFLIDADTMDGPVNAVAPQSVTNVEFTQTLGSVLRRPTSIPVPALAIRLLMGEMGEELVLASQRAVPDRLQDTGFAFRYPSLERSLRHALDRPAETSPSGNATFRASSVESGDR
jgi:uncharacterized protein (TIGR01777 family)